MDITSNLRITPQTANSILFNPSIGWLENNFYILAIRNFCRYPNMKFYDSEGLQLPPEKYHINPIFNPQHPWLGGDESATYWQKFKDSSDTTDIFLISFDGEAIKIYQFITTLPDMVDVRIFRENYDAKKKTWLFRLIGNKNDLVTFNAKYKLRNGKPCDWAGPCTIIVDQPIEITRISETAVTITMLKKVYAPCMHLSSQTEKNWSLWNWRGNIYISYFLFPQHRVFLYKSDIDCTELPISRSPNEENLFSKLERYYKNGKFKISLSTPACYLPDYKVFFAVGHISMSNWLVQISGNDPLGKWIEINGSKELVWHPRLAYFAFFYIFNPHIDGFPLTYVSPAFMIEGFEPYPLCFPSGLALNEEKNSLILSYGESDIRAKLLEISVVNAVKTCRKIQSYTAKSYPFGILTTTGEIKLPI